MQTPNRVTSDQLVELTTEWQTERPHVVILGAGASLAACPTGDAHGRQLPLMNNFIDVLELRDIVAGVGEDSDRNFEEIYSSLADRRANATMREIERRVHAYFSVLQLPRCLTLYDLLLMSLRRKDAIFTFNWDPFLADAFERCEGDVPLPHVFHLHGNVRVAFCVRCKSSTMAAKHCSSCGEPLIPTELLYPIDNKNYGGPFLETQWDAARDFIARAGMITIFGYSAPVSDQQAMSIFTEAWKESTTTKLIERVEIIDVQEEATLAEKWSSFSFFNHLDTCRSLYDSWLMRFPRRSCEALAHVGFNGQTVQQIPWAGNRDGLQESLRRMVSAERKWSSDLTQGAADL